ncbi:MAG: type II toxin-antitoxin system VapC family toxin [Bryobacteraceae bacterium]
MMVADTDVLIDFLNGKGPAADRIALELSARLTTTAITRFELLSGAKSPATLARVKRLLAAIGTLELDADSVDQAAQIRRELEKSGARIGMADSLIAGIVVRRRGILLTRNRRHFEKVPDLHLGTI